MAFDAFQLVVTSSRILARPSPGRLEPRSEREHRDRAWSNYPVAARSAFRQHGEFMDADEGRHIQPRILPFPDREVIFRELWPRGDGRCDKIVISGVQEDDRRTRLS